MERPTRGSEVQYPTWRALKQDYLVVGRVLDAGSVLNHAHVLDGLPHGDLTIVTLEPEPHAFFARRISYVYADLRELPFRDGELLQGEARTTGVLDTMAAPGGPLHRSGGKYHWCDTSFPADTVSLDGAEIDNVTARLMTVYEVNSPMTSKAVRDRCLTYLNGVNEEILLDVRQTWPSHVERLRKEGHA